MDGYEVCRRLRRLPQQEDTLVIGVSGFPPRDPGKTRDAGIDHYMTKPADPRQIAEYLRNGRRREA